ncbi:MAG: TldD/PmbA family protein [Alphaproteobacteria bacterium]|nr:TldD/PmbA family protein [Alphaproteobacteria bacterium]
MKMDRRQQQKQDLKALSQSLFQTLDTDEHLTLAYSGEESLFIRVNKTTIRQISEVTQANLSLDFISGRHHTECTFSLSGDVVQDTKQALKIIEQCRLECKSLPEDPFLVLPEAGESSEEDHFGAFAPLEKLADILLKPAASLDLAGLYAAGTLMRASINSKGQFHWFSTDNFYFDYSLYTLSQKAIKSIYAGNEWKDEDYWKNLEQAKNQLKALDKTSKKLSPGKYRVYFAPAAVAEFSMAWSGLSEKALKEGRSPLKQLAEGETKLSPLLSLEEDFNQGLVPRFNEFGEVSPLKISLITQGKLMSTLVNRRTAQEYGIVSNGANGGEGTRSPRMLPGHLNESMILSSIGTGLYVSNLHYLNWSDLQQGRITGMTRYGCFWVENGEIVSPIQDMRFDETLYSFFGSNLEAIGDTVQLIPHTWSYWERSLGGNYVPGILVNDFSFTL